MEELKNLYTKILSLTKSLEYFIEKGDTEKIDDILSKRLEVVGLAIETKQKEGSNQEIEELAKQIKSLDKKNFSRLKEIKKDIEQELFSLTKNTKAVSAYKTSTNARSRLVDKKYA